MNLWVTNSCHRKISCQSKINRYSNFKWINLITWESSKFANCFPNCPDFHFVWEDAYRKRQSTVNISYFTSREGFHLFETQHEGRRRFNIWHDLVAFHKYSGRYFIFKFYFSFKYLLRKHGAPSIHSSESFEKSFLPWHRYYLWEFETNLQYYADDCGVTLPYTQTHILHKDSVDVTGKRETLLTF